MCSLCLLFQFPLGPSLCRGSLLRPGGRLSRLLRPGGRLSRLLRPGGHPSRLLRPGGRLSRLLRPGGRLACQSHLTSLLACQSLLTPQQFTQCHFTSLPPHPGGLLSYWPHMDLALCSLPRFHLRSTALLDCAVCEASRSRSLGGACPDHCIAPIDDSALPLCHLFSLLDSACLTSSCLSIKLQLDLTTLPLHYIHSEIMTKLDGQCIYASHDRTIWYWNKKWFLYSSHLCIKWNSLCSN